MLPFVTLKLKNNQNGDRTARKTTNPADFKQIQPPEGMYHIF